MGEHKYFEAAKKLAIEQNGISLLTISEKFNLGSNSASFLMDELEAAGIVSPFNGQIKRKLLLKK
jgi:DNA segregation ATPase FtsK/SpoIIIE-like protein